MDRQTAENWCYITDSKHSGKFQFSMGEWGLGDSYQLQQPVFRHLSIRVATPLTLSRLELI